MSFQGADAVQQNGGTPGKADAVDATRCLEIADFRRAFFFVSLQKSYHCV